MGTMKFQDGGITRQISSEVVNKPSFNILEVVEEVKKPVFSIREVNEKVIKPSFSIVVEDAQIIRPHFSIVEDYRKVDQPVFKVVEREIEVLTPHLTPRQSWLVSSALLVSLILNIILVLKG